MVPRGSSDADSGVSGRVAASHNARGIYPLVDCKTLSGPHLGVYESSKHVLLPGHFKWT